MKKFANYYITLRDVKAEKITPQHNILLYGLVDNKMFNSTVKCEITSTFISRAGSWNSHLVKYKRHACFIIT